ncbi:MAG: MFS transporter [Pseudomonadota bacterium]
MVKSHTTSVSGLATFFGVMYLVQSLGDPGSGIIAQPVRSMLKSEGVSADEIAAFMAIVGLPWAIKPLLGLLSDFVPLFGSRRRNYLILAILGACLGTAILAGMPVLASDRGYLLALLLLSAMGVAFGDVLIDGLMVTEGQPRGLTGVLQSVQWTAAYLGLLVTGIAGGYLAQLGRPDLAFALCACLWGISLVLAVALVREPEVTPAQSLLDLKEMVSQIWAMPGLGAVTLFLLVWNFNPLWTSVLYLHLTESLGGSEVDFGEFLSVFSFGAMLGSLTYPLYCTRIRLGYLVQASIVLGILGNLVYLWIDAPDSVAAWAIACTTGMTYMAGTMIHLDIAARRAPLVAAASVFALLMALSNLSSSLSEAAGGALYQYLLPMGTDTAYSAVVITSAVFPAFCWLLVPWLRRAVPEWFNREPRI